MQFPKTLYGTIDECMDAVNQSFNLSDSVDKDFANIPGLTVIKGMETKINQGGTSRNVYIITGETDYAFYCFMYEATKLDDSKKALFEKMCATFKEDASARTNVSDNTVSDTIKWFNATHAVYTKLYNFSSGIFGDVEATEENAAAIKEGMKSSWEIVDKDSADQTIEWLIAEGHRDPFGSDMVQFEEAGIESVASEERAQWMIDNFNVGKDLANVEANLYDEYKKYGEQTISAWDYSRAMMLLGWCYVGGYYTEAEALDKSLEVAKIIQKEFDSWESFTESYLRGYQYWAEESGDDRYAAYESLKEQENGPFSVDWNLTFEKTW